MKEQAILEKKQAKLEKDRIEEKNRLEIERIEEKGRLEVVRI